METEGVIKFALTYECRALHDVDLAELQAWRRILFALNLVGQDAHRYGGLGFGNVSMRTPSGFVISGSQTGHLGKPSAEAYAEVTSWQANDNRIVARGLTRPSSESLTHAALYDLSADIRFVFHVHSPDIWQNIRARSGRNVDVPKEDTKEEDIPEDDKADRVANRFQETERQETGRINVDVPESPPESPQSAAPKVLESVDVPNMKNMDVPETGEGVAYGTPAMAAEVRRVCAGRSLPAAFIMGGHEDGVVAYGADADGPGLLLVRLLAESLRNF